MKTRLLTLGLILAALATTSAIAQTKQKGDSANPAISPTASSASAKDCSCSGTNLKGDACSCSCKGTGCVCTCGDGIGCSCQASPGDTVSLAAGTTINSAAQTISATAGALGPRVIVLSGGDQTLPFDINTTSWQVLARLTMLPGVRLGVELPDPQVNARNALQRIPGFSSTSPQPTARVQEIRRVPLERTVTLCVHEDAGLPAALDALSRSTGYAFDAYGTPAAHFTLTARGSLQDVVSQLASVAGVSISIAR